MLNNREPLSTVLSSHHMKLHALRMEVLNTRDEYDNELEAYEKGCLDTISKQLDHLHRAFFDITQLIKARTGN